MKIKILTLVTLVTTSNMAFATDSEKCKAQFDNVITSVKLLANDDIPAPKADKEKAKLTLKNATIAAEQGDYCKAVQIIFD